MVFTANIGYQADDKIIVLKDTSTGTVAEIYPFGALLNTYSVYKNGQLVNIVDGYASVADAKANIRDLFKSAKLSPFVCRMRNGEYDWDNKRYQMNSHYINGHAIHGLLFNGNYTVAGIQSEDNYASVTLEYKYTGSDAGYPFSYTISITWTLECNNRLRVSTLVINTGQQAIPMTDGWHPYFTLGGLVDEWVLQFNSRKQLVYDEALLPNGQTLTDSRFENGIALKGVELDNSFEFEVDKPACVLSSASLKLTIEPDKSYPILQVYIPPDRKSIAIENLSGAPDNFNNKIHLLVLRPGEKKVFSTSYTVS